MILDQNLFNIDVTSIDKTKVLATYLAGNATFVSASFDNQSG